MIFAADVIVDVAEINPAVNMLPPATLPVTLRPLALEKVATKVGVIAVVAVV